MARQPPTLDEFRRDRDSLDTRLQALRQQNNFILQVLHTNSKVLGYFKKKRFISNYHQIESYATWIDHYKKSEGIYFSDPRTQLETIQKLKFMEKSINTYIDPSIQELYQKAARSPEGQQLLAGTVAPLAMPLTPPKEDITIEAMNGSQLKESLAFIDLYYNHIRAYLNDLKQVNQTDLLQLILRTETELDQERIRYDPNRGPLQAIADTAPSGDPAVSAAQAQLVQYYTQIESIKNKFESQLSTKFLSTIESLKQQQEKRAQKKERELKLIQLKKDTDTLLAQVNTLLQKSIELPTNREQNDSIQTLKEGLEQLKTTFTTKELTPEEIKAAFDKHDEIQKRILEIAEEQGGTSIKPILKSQRERLAAIQSKTLPSKTEKFLNKLPPEVRRLAPDLSKSGLASALNSIQRKASASRKPEQKKYKIGKLFANQLDTKVAIFGESYDFRLLHTKSQLRARANSSTNTKPTYASFFNTTEDKADSLEEVKETLFYLPRDTFDQRYLGWMEDSDLNKKQLRNFFRFVFGSSIPANKEIFDQKLTLDPIDKIPCEGDSQEQKDLVTDFRRALAYRLKMLREEVIAVEEVLPESDEKRRRLETMMQIVQFINKLDSRDKPCMDVTREEQTFGVTGPGAGPGSGLAGIPDDQIEIKKFLEIILRRLRATAGSDETAEQIRRLQENLQQMINPTTIQEILDLFNDSESARRVQQLQMELKECRDQLRSVRDEMRRLAAEGSSAAATVTRLQQREKELQEEIDELKRNEREDAALVERRQADLDAYVRELQAQQTAQTAAQQARITALEAELAEATGRLEALRGTLGAREEELAGVQTTLQAAQAALRGAREDVVGVTADVEARTRERDAARADVGRLTDERDALQRRIDTELTPQIAQLEANLQAATERATTAEARAANLQEQLTAATTRATAADIATAEQRTRAETAEGRAAAAEREAAEQRTRAETAEGRAAVAEGARGTTGQELIAARAEANRLRGEAARQQAAAAAATAEAARQQADAAAARAEADRLRGDAAAAREAKAVADQEVADARQTIAATGQQLATSKALMDTTNRQISELTRALASKTQGEADCLAREAALQARIAELERLLREALSRAGGKLPEPVHQFETPGDLPEVQRYLSPEQAAGVFNIWDTFLMATLQGKTAFKREPAPIKPKAAVLPGEKKPLPEKAVKGVPFVDFTDDTLLNLHPEEGEELNKKIVSIFKDPGFHPTLIRLRATRDGSFRPADYGGRGTGWMTQSQFFQGPLKRTIERVSFSERNTPEERQEKIRTRLSIFLQSLDPTLRNNFMLDLFLISYLAVKEDDSKVQHLYDIMSTLGLRPSDMPSKEKFYNMLRFRLPARESELQSPYQALSPELTEYYQRTLYPRGSGEGYGGRGGGSRSKNTNTETISTEDLCAELLMLMLKAAAKEDDFDTPEFLQTAAAAFQDIGTCPLIVEFLQRLLTHTLSTVDEAWEDGYTLIPLAEDDEYGAHIPSLLGALESHVSNLPSRRSLASAATALFPSLRATLHSAPAQNLQSLLGSNPYILVSPTSKPTEETPLLLRLPDDSEPVELEGDDVESLNYKGIGLGELLYLYMLAANDTLSASEQKLARCPLNPLLNQLSQPLQKGRRGRSRSPSPLISH